MHSSLEPLFAWSNAAPHLRPFATVVRAERSDGGATIEIATDDERWRIRAIGVEDLLHISGKATPLRLAVVGGELAALFFGASYVVARGFRAEPVPPVRPRDPAWRDACDPFEMLVALHERTPTRSIAAAMALAHRLSFYPPLGRLQLQQALALSCHYNGPCPFRYGWLAQRVRASLRDVRHPMRRTIERDLCRAIRVVMPAPIVPLV